MEFREGVITFAPHAGSGPQEIRQRVAYDRRVGKASAVLLGYTARFVDKDHHFGRLIVSLRSEIVNNSTTGPEVEVVATFGLRDKSQDWDDAYAGEVRYCVISEPEQVRPVRDPHILDNPIVRD